MKSRFLVFLFYFSYQQRLKQIAIYMRPIFELDEILQQDAHEDEQRITPSTPILSIERLRTYSDSSMASIDGEPCIKNQLGVHSLLTNNEPQPLFSNEIELYGTQLVNPLLFC